MGQLDSKIAIVTGAARNVGLGIAERMVAEGARVVMADILGDEVRDAAKSVSADPKVAAPFEVDVADPDGLERLFDFTDRELGPVDVLVNNAAIVDIGLILDKTVEEYDRVMDVNVRSLFLASQAAARRMKDKGGGAIVNITSLAAWIADQLTAAYVASKGAQEAATRAFAVPLGEHGIRINSVAPGIVETTMNKAQLDAQPGYREDAESHVPLGRFGTPADIAAAVVFLASDEASWITGATLVVDGGTTCQFPARYTRELVPSP